MPKEAEIISMTIKDLLKISLINRNIKSDNIVVTDGTANVGGNTLSFSSHFKKVNSIEYNHNTFEGLKHNCKNIYKRKNIEFYDFTKINIDEVDVRKKEDLEKFVLSHIYYITQQGAK
jgi:hypothetical protein